ncbi:MAG: phosphoribosylformylglycinamidine synthase subunit PurS [Gemmatimonadales bacterium]|nr:Phosphoribosylformylglycinamidine synthase subunit PurS [bacterium HR33]GIW50837.1 MAG: phosphoribosylformylglycinamidine synthase subunit PurS [Gemmatimonadales bacterium]
MPDFEVEVRVMPRESLLDPQGQTVEHALHALGFGEVRGVRIGRAIKFSLSCGSAEEAERSVRAMCERLLANPVTEDFHIAVRKAS